MDGWPGWDLWNGLDALPGVGSTIASKLFARKRPRLRPIWDSVIEAVIESPTLWEPLRVALRQDDGALHERLLRLHRDAHLPDEVSPLRVFDVICWKEGKKLGYGAKTR